MVASQASMLAFVRRARVACLRDRFGGWRGLIGAAFLSACTFPKYDFASPGGSAGSSGSGTGGGFAGSSLNGGQGGSAGGAPIGGNAGDSGMGGGLMACPAMAGAGGAPPAVAHCSDGKKDGDETGLDCGGPVCSVCFHSEGCQHDSDCISTHCATTGTCDPLFDLRFRTVVGVRNTDTLQFQLQLTYLEPTVPLPLKDVAVRYYFARGDVADPVVPFDTLADLNMVSIASQVRWNIVRVLPDSAALADSYLEITFTSPKILLQNDVIVLTQSIEDGSAANRPFDQFTHYSFQNVADYTLEETATVYRQGKLSWGKPPPYTVPDQCFFAAVNFGGDALTAGGLDFQAGVSPLVQFNGAVYRAAASDSAPAPPPDTAYLPMLKSAIVLDSASATLSVPNGNYWFYPYVVSGDGANTADFLVQGSVVDTFVAESLAGGPAWAKLGPYFVTVKNGKVVLSSGGGPVRLAGAELYQAAQ